MQALSVASTTIDQMSHVVLLQYTCCPLADHGRRLCERTWSFGSFLDDLCMEMIGYMRLGTPG